MELDLRNLISNFSIRESENNLKLTQNSSNAENITSELISTIFYSNVLKAFQNNNDQTVFRANAPIFEVKDSDLMSTFDGNPEIYLGILIQQLY